MDVSALGEIGNLVREKIVFACVAGGLAFVVYEAHARRRAAKRGGFSAEGTGGHTGPATPGALAGAAALVAGFQLTGQLQLWG